MPDRPTASPASHSPRILGLDVGSKTIGLAVSDLLGITAQGLQTLRRRNKRTDFGLLQKVITEYCVTEIVVGYPLRMSGVEGIQAEKMQAFAEELRKKFALPVHLWDERLSSAEANRVLRDSEMSIQRRGEVVDRLAAVLILQSSLSAVKSFEFPGRNSYLLERSNFHDYNVLISRRGRRVGIACRLHSVIPACQQLTDLCQMPFQSDLSFRVLLCRKRINIQAAPPFAKTDCSLSDKQRWPKFCKSYSRSFSSVFFSACPSATAWAFAPRISARKGSAADGAGTLPNSRARVVTLRP